MTTRNRTRARGAAVVVLLLALLLASALAARPALAREAEVDITIYPIPNLAVMPGQTIAYKLRVENRGNSTMDYARVRLPYDPAQIVLVDTLFDDPEEDYIEAIDANTIRLYIGNVAADTSRFIVLFARVADDLPLGSVINMVGGFTWEDQSGNFELNRRTNAAPLIVAETSRETPYVWMLVDPPRGPVGTEFYFFSDRFVPGERVRPWLTFPDGRVERFSSLSQTVDPNGRVRLRASSDELGLTPGTYQVRLVGENSDIEAVADFVVE